MNVATPPLQKLIMIDVNIYLTKDAKKELCKLKNKYYLSFSTIAQIIVDEMIQINMWINNQWYDTTTVLTEKYIHEKVGQKTHIKPRIMKTWKDSYQKVSILYTNALMIYLRKEMKNYWQTEKTLQFITSKIGNRLANTHDDNWNGNQLSRFIPKFIKQNPKYVKEKLLGIKD